MPNLTRLAPLAAWALVVVARPARPQGGAPQPADLLLVNTRIYTVDQSRPFVAAMAVRDGRVQFVGSTQEAMLLRGPSTRVLDLNGSTVIPGMIDAHAHLFGLGTFLHNIDLRDTRSYDEVVARVADRVKQAPAGRWIVGRAWDQNRWGNTRFPTHQALSRVSPNNPVVLTRVDGHAILVNAAAMRAAGVTAASKDPAGGRIERGSGGEPTGVFVDNAMGLVEKAVPPLSHDEMQSAALDAIAESNRWGLTALDDPGEPRDVLDVFEELAKAGKFNLRVYAMITDDSAAIEHYFQRGPQSGLYDNRLWIRSIKLYADGALGSRGAALLDPYNDDPKNVGLLKSTPEHLRDVSIRALRHGFQVATHAIGDRGNRVALDAYEAALKTVPTVDHRFRIEHVQILDHADVPRFAKLGVIPSMQAVHQTSDMYWAPNRLGYARTLGAYAWRSLLNTGVVIPNGSDFPVERVNPLFSFHAAVSRQDDDNWPPNGWFPEQRMTRQEALESITIWPAYAAFQEQVMGSLSPGKLADFVILDRDIMTVPESDILGTHVLATYIGGRAVFERGR
ncbi:MAG TPA: amidohydrolase family protein [Gemmatimonadaceae bacterium]|nr:amidohydrolase family protein [Gemmatimonadaceae bacterium]